MHNLTCGIARAPLRALRLRAVPGAPQLDPDELWLRYRQRALNAYVAPRIAAGMAGMHDESIALEGVRRGVAALVDLETVAAMRQSLAS